MQICLQAYPQTVTQKCHTHILAEAAGVVLFLLIRFIEKQAAIQIGNKT